MRLKQVEKLINGGCLVCNCINVGRFIGVINDESKEKYKNCIVTSIGSTFYRERGIEVWIIPNKRLQKELCSKCSWVNCWENPNFEED